MSAKIAAAIHQVMSQVGYVQKKGQHPHYKYASEADLLRALRPPMVEAGLMLLPSVRSVSPIDQYGNICVTVEYTLLHESGETWPEKLVGVGYGNDKNARGVGDKGIYKALTGCQKYVLMKLFALETGDDPTVGIPDPFTEVSDPEVPSEDELMESGRAAATEGTVALREWWVRLTPEGMLAMKQIKDTELKPMALKADGRMTNGV